MSPLRPTNFRLDDTMLAALHRIRNRDGIPVSEQVRRALVTWVQLKGESLPSARPEPTDADVAMERRVRARARRMGYRVNKSRAPESIDNHGLYMVADASSNYCVLGDRFDATLQEIEEYLNEVQ